MKIRDYKMVKTDTATITIKKDQNHYRSTYSVCFFSKDTKTSIKTTCKNRSEAKAEFIRLMKLYSFLTISEILKL
jgi:predicted adenine nucleotide alpha hydrolase (AANH) superfamily ATPase